MKAFRLQKKADRYFDSFSFIDAIKMYERVLRYDSVSNWSKLRLAEAYIKINNSDKAEYWFGQVDTAYLKSMPAELTDFASVLVKNRKYDSAQYLFQNYLSHNSKASLVLEKDLDRLLRDSIKFIVKPAAFNSEASEFGAVFYQDGVVFASARKPKSPVKYVYNWDHSNYLELYYKSLTEGDTAEPVKFSPKINTRYHEGPAVFYNGDKDVIFTRNNFHKGASKLSDDGINKLQLFHSRRDPKSAEWSTPKKINIVGDNYSAAHPTVSSDGSVMYFTSDIPGGYGKSDIYRTFFRDSVWNTPENLGPVVNSARNDVFPFLAKDDLLYFASDGHGGLGGLDIYRANFLPDGSVIVENLGYPVNTSKDDFALMLKGRRGFFSSNREGGLGNDDLYEILLNFIEVEPVLVDPSGKAMAGAISVLDKTTCQPLNLYRSGSRLLFEAINGHEYQITGEAPEYLSASVEFSSEGILFSNEPYLLKLHLKKKPHFFFAGIVTPETSSEPLPSRIELESDKLAYTFNTLDDGKFLIPLPDSGSYFLHVKAHGFFTATDSFEVSSNKDDFYLEKTYRLKRIEAGVKVKLDHVYFATNKTEILPGSFKELNEVLAFLNENPEIQIEIGGHTDDKGSEDYNRRLSLGRAESVRRYLIQNGIRSERIKAFGYGESQPEVDNHTEENRQVNRRVEFKILAAHSSFPGGK